MRYRLDQPTDTTQRNLFPEAATEAEANQIFLDLDTLYLLKNDGSVWRVPNALTAGSLEPQRQLVADADIQEIAANQGRIYMLRQDGAIWLYQDQGSLEDSPSVSLDQGVGTLRIFAALQGLFFLKDSGQVFFIPANPAQFEANRLRRLELPTANRSAIALIETTLLALEIGPAGRLEMRAQDVSQSAPMLAPQVDLDLTGTAAAIAATAAAAATQTAEAAVVEATTTAAAIEANKTAAAAATPEAIALEIATPTPTQTAETPPVPPIAAPGPPPAGEFQAPTPTDEADLELMILPTETPTILVVATATPLPSPTPAGGVRLRSLDDAVEVLVNQDREASRRFWIDSTEVTNRQYGLCVAAGACPENKQYSELFSRNDHPVVGVNYQQAQAYCAWVGGALPSARLWREAATPKGAPFPWGNEPARPTCEVAVINEICDSDEPGSRPVRSRPAGARRFEDSEALVYDLIGNVWEWTQEPGSGKDGLRIVLGGSWSNPDSNELGSYAAFEPFNNVVQGEEHQERNLGFRCVRPFEN
jgi:formylglycine-generating enzyme required for sulfatase activity